MSGGIPRASRVGLLLALSLAVSGPSFGFRACLLDDDLPRAQRSTASGYDYELLAELAAALDSPFEVVWSSSRPSFSEIESSDLPLARLARGECDAVGSVPGAEALGEWSDLLTLSVPYYGAGFEIIVASSHEGPGAPRSLEQLANLRVAVRLQSLAHSVLAAHNANWRAVPTTDGMISRLEAEEVDAALVWGPALASSRHSPVTGSEPARALRWNEHVAIRDPLLLAWVNEVIRRMSESGELARLAGKYGFPFHSPFSTTSDRVSLRELKSGGGSGHGSTP